MDSHWDILKQSSVYLEYASYSFEFHEHLIEFGSDYIERCSSSFCFFIEQLQLGFSDDQSLKDSSSFIILCPLSFVVVAYHNLDYFVNFYINLLLSVSLIISKN